MENRQRKAEYAANKLRGYVDARVNPWMKNSNDQAQAGGSGVFGGGLREQIMEELGVDPTKMLNSARAFKLKYEGLPSMEAKLETLTFYLVYVVQWRP